VCSWCSRSEGSWPSYRSSAGGRSIRRRPCRTARPMRSTAKSSRCPWGRWCSSRPMSPPASPCHSSSQWQCCRWKNSRPMFRLTMIHHRRPVPQIPRTPARTPTRDPVNSFRVSLTFVHGTRCRYLCWRGVLLISARGIIDCFLESANVSLFAYLSLICGICARSKMLMLKMLMFKRRPNNRRGDRVAASPKSER
jgi:hypothetical protein